MSEEELSVDEELELPDELILDDEIPPADSSIDDLDLGFKVSTIEEY
jgi:hypothetical protein